MLVDHPMDDAKKVMRFSPADWCTLIAIAWVLGRIVLRLKRQGFHQTLAWTRQRQLPGRGRPSAQNEREWFRRVRGVARRLPFRAECLPQSLLLWNLLNHAGSETELVMGVENGQDGIEAHAWLERGRSALYENPDKLARFTEMQRHAWAREQASPASAQVEP